VANPVTARFCSAVQPAVEDPRVVVDDLVRLVRAAGAAEADRVRNRAVALHEALLDHHRRLGRGQVVAVVAEHVQRGRRDPEPLAQHEHVGHAAGGPALPVPTVGAAAAERVDEPLVPASRAGERSRLRLRDRVVQHGGLVDAPVGRAGLHPHDERRRDTERGRRGRQIGGVPVRPRRERTRCGAVEVVHAGLDRTVAVQRGPEVAAEDGQRELLGLTHERLLVRAGEHRALDGVVDDRARGGPGARRRRPDRAAPQAVDECGDPVDVRVLAEQAGDVPPVDVHPDPVQRHVCLRLDPDQRVTAGHGVRPAGQHADAQPSSTGRLGEHGLRCRQPHQQSADHDLPHGTSLTSAGNVL
jgi:hypothetical protein